MKHGRGVLSSQVSGQPARPAMSVLWGLGIGLYRIEQVGAKVLLRLHKSVMSSPESG